MKVQILRGFCLGGGVDVAPGDVVDIPDARVPVLIQQGRVVPMSEVSPEPEAAPAKTTRTRKGAKNV